MTSSLYVHIPYCNTVCTYCDFCKMYYNPEQVSKYIDQLKKELIEVYHQEKLKTIYIGGGTPSCLSEKELHQLFSTLKLVKVEKETEYTVECNFDSITKEKLELLKNYGVNRLSFGLETINPKGEEYLGRKNDLEHIKKIISYAGKIGFKNINIDLIYAYQNETIKALENDIDFLLSLEPTHISTYSLIIEKNTKLSIRKEHQIDSDLDYEMYQLISKKLKQAGYIHYEISNFAKPGYESKHNLVYWHNENYYGIGLGASSYHNNQRITNTRSITKYLKGMYHLEIENLDEKDKMIYEIILNLRLLKGIKKEDFLKKYQKKLEEVFLYQDLIKQGLIKEENGYLKIPEEKLYISNYIIEEFIYGKE